MIPALVQHHVYLRLFWHKVGGTQRRKYRSQLSRDATLQLLIDLGSINLGYHSKHTSRAQFERKKHTKPFTGFRSCFACGAAPEIRHHILWLKHGGRNTPRNVIALCRACHAAIHPWLAAA